MDKPQKPTNLLPRSFGGQKEAFDADKIANGYQPDVPDILGGANLNYTLDIIGKELDYTETIADFVNGLPINNIITADENNKLAYKDLSTKQDTLIAGENITIENNIISAISKSSHYNLFDLIYSDHILEGDEAKGKALLGTYVYKNAAPGREGYPELYNRCVEEYQNATNQVVIENNVQLVGAPAIDNGVAGGFSASDYLKVGKATPDTLSSFESSFKFTTGGDVTTSQCPFVYDEPSTGTGGILVQVSAGKLYIHLATNNSSWDIAHGVTVADIVANTTYTVKYLWDGSTFKVFLNGTELASYKATIIYTAQTGVTLGGRIRYTGEYFRGSIDLKECYIKLNGEMWWQGATSLKKNANKHVFYDIADKSVVDDIFDSTGVAWFYGVDEENERIFLPRSVRYFKNGSLDTVGEFGRAAIPNITGSVYCQNMAGGGNGAGWQKGSYGNALRTGSGGAAIAGGNNWATCNNTIYLNALDSSSVYSDDATTVDVDYTNFLVYMVVGTTEGTSAPIDAIDITTSENDTIPLGFSTYQGAAQPSLAWLAAKDSWEDGNEYVSFFNEFKDKVGQPFCNGFVRNYTDEYTKYDLVINQDDMTFRLPLLNGSENLIDYSAGVELKDSSLPYTFNQKGELLVRSKAVNNNGTNLYINNEMVFESYGGGQYAGNDQAVYSVKNGDTITSKLGTFGTIMFYPAIGNGTLYFKVANAVQNLEVLNAAEIKANMLTRANKAEIVGWGMPDYSAGVILANGIAAPSDGLVILNSGTTGNANLAINGFSVLRAQDNNNNAHFMIPTPVSKGDIITANNLGGGGSIIFYPLKGVQQ